MTKILVTGEIPQKGLEFFVEKHEVEVFRNVVLIFEDVLKERVM